MGKLEIVEENETIPKEMSSTNVTESILSTVPTVPVVPTKGKLCLNMIVKNESRIIERLLSSVLSIIDTYCITDTGSNDDTPNIIREFMKKHNKPGEVIIEPFKNFGYNRTFALQKAEPWGEYALLLDADMKLVISPDFNPKDLTADGYLLLQGNPSMKYYNTRIVKTNIGVKCVSPTHEYYDFPKDSVQVKLHTLYIDDIGDGGCKADKFERDIRLLKEGLEEEPNNGRYHFYIGNSYKNIGKYEEAIDWYKKRVKIGGWHEEVFYSLYEIGNAYSDLKRMESAIYYWMEAWNHHPKRSESLYEIVKHYREISKHTLAQYFCDLGKSIPFPKDDVLFIKTPVYEYLFDYEQSILAYYTKKPINHYNYLSLLGKQYHKDNVLSNYIFYVKKIKSLAKKYICFNDKTEKEIMGVKDTFVSSSPCIISDGEGYRMNIRYVNYTIKDDGSYAFRLDDGKIRTLNKLVYLNKDLKVNESKSHWFDEVHNPELRYQGVEDVKLFVHKNKTYFSGTVEDNGVLRIGYGDYNSSKNVLTPTSLVSPNGRGCEKNWVFCSNLENDMKVIYEWSPLTIGEIGNDKASLTNITKNEEVPDFFRDIRGSTNGVRVKDEVWFLCHLVQYCTPRKYYHIIVILDAKTLKYKKHSILFKFEEERIEYSLGMAVNPKEVIFSYSTMDRTSNVLVMTRNTVDEELFPE
jgi:tetratricopeptide (TPR) repeat protein